MPSPNRFLKVNPYLLRLTDDDPELRWVSTLMWHWVLLWAANFIWAWLALLMISNDTFISTSVLGLVISALFAGILLASFVLSGLRLVSAEAQNGHLADSHLAHLSQTAILWSLVMGTLYRARYWLTWIIGLCPFLLFLIARWSLLGETTDTSNMYCVTSMLGTNYCYAKDGGASISNLLLMLFWTLCLTSSILGIVVLAAQSSIGLAIKSKSILLSVVGALIFTLPLMLAIILVVAPNGYVITYTLYDAAFGGAIGLCLVVAALPFIASWCVQRLFLLPLFKS